MAANSTDNKNGTFISSTAAKTTFLVVFLLVGLFGNLFLAIAIGGNRKLRSTVIHIITLNLALTNLVDCLLNFSFAIGYTVSPTADLDDFLCRLNSFVMNFVTIERPLTLTLLSLDRFIYSVFPDKYVCFQNIPRTAFMICCTWIYSLLFSFPLAAGLIDIEIYNTLSVCLPSEDVNTGYLTFYTILCFVLPICAIVIFFIFIIKCAFSQRDHIHTIMTQHQYSKDKDSNQLQCLNEMCVTKTVGLLCLIWVICEVPFLSAFIVRLTFTNISYSSCVMITMLWLKFAYVMTLPLISFTFNKDFWYTFKDMVLCKKRNSVVDTTKTEYSPDTTKESFTEKLKSKAKQIESKKIIKDEPSKEVAIKNSGFQVPVFFATADGVHMHTLEDDESLSENEDIYENPKVMKCDVIGSQEYLNQCDTSDYDSSNELGPFSVSHPVTSKSFKDPVESIQRRSNSHPEVRSKTCDTSINTSVTLSSAVDSGLDISTTILTNDSSRSLLIKQDKREGSQSNTDNKTPSIPGEVSDINYKTTIGKYQMQNQDISFSNRCQNTLSSLPEFPKHKKNRKRHEESKTEKQEDSQVSSVLSNMKPPLKLQPIPYSPNRLKINHKLSLDLLSTKQLCDTSKSVVTPSACMLVPNT